MNRYQEVIAKLIKHKSSEDEAERKGYVNGCLDAINAITELDIQANVVKAKEVA